MDDHELILKAQQGNVDAYGELYERHAPGIFRFVYAHLVHRQDAEDLTEEVFFRAWRSLPRYHERGVPFQFYLLRVARNALIDHYRHTRLLDQSVVPPGDDPDSTWVDPHGEAREMAEEHQFLVDCLRQLSEDHRTVLVLRFFNHLTPAETAVVMGRSPGAIRTLQHRALIALRVRIQIETNRDVNELPNPNT